ncbi:hypothetical protein [Kineococcus sp. G2]|uniref:hypothetical protein n=1 Tax=Kineococcus sp. G2 TaxID=3127484 RepID=UPI00301C7E1E
MVVGPGGAGGADVREEVVVVTVLVSLVVILLVAALVGRTVARSRPGARPSTGRPSAGLGIELPDVVGDHRRERLPGAARPRPRR